MNALLSTPRRLSSTLAERLPASSVLVLACLASFDGTIVLLTASGVLSTWQGAVATGLTVIAGAGTWLAARHEFGARRLDVADAFALALIGVAVAASVAAAALVGGHLASGDLELSVMPKAAGIALLLVALEVGGVHVPRLSRVPLPLATVVLAVPLEAWVQWSH